MIYNKQDVCTSTASRIPKYTETTQAENLEHSRLLTDQIKGELFKKISINNKLYYA